MKKYVRYLLVLLMCGSLMGVKAQKTFQVDGINYYLDGSEARVSDNRYYSGSKIIIPNSVLYDGKNYPVTSIADRAFDFCISLTEVTIPNSVFSIGGSAFEGCTGLTTVTIGNSVTTIEFSAFSDCTNLATVTIGNSVTAIGNMAFSDCTSLTEVTIPNSVISIGSNAFANCGLKTVTIGNSVTTIGDGAFYNCTNLIEITIPNSVTSIGSCVFWNCTGLTTVTIGNSVTSIGSNAFFSCIGLKKVIWNARNTQNFQYDSNPFSYSDRLTDFVFGEEVEYIPAYLCYEFTSLKNLVIGNSVTSIGSCAFLNCRGLTEVTMPNSVTTIGKSAFSNCTSLTEVSIPNSVTSIESNAFNGCTQMESVTIGEKVESIGESAFAKCNSLTAVTSKAVTPPQIWVTTFDDYAMPLYVPAGCKPKYAEAKHWRNFTDIREATLYKVTANATDETMGYVTGAGEYPQGGTATLIAVPFGQNYFVRWNDGNTDNPRTITVTGDMTFTAEFAPAGSAVETLENGERGIYATGRTLHVENGGESYRVYTAAGRLVYTGNDSSVTLSAPGMYIVRTSDRSQKVAVK